MLPANLRFIKQAEPLPTIEAAALETVPKHQVIHFQGTLENQNMVSERKNIYIPISGTNGRVWLEKRKRIRQQSLENTLDITATVDTAGALNTDMQKALARSPYATTPWPVKILKSSSPPTVGSKIYRSAVTVFAILLLPFTIIRSIRILQEMSKKQSS